MFNLATFILSSLMAIQSWTVELPFKTVGLPNETALDHYGQEVRVTFTMDEQTLEDIPDESTLVSILEQQFSSSGQTFVSPMLNYFPTDDNDTGELDLLFSYNGTTDERRLFISFNNGMGSRQITQSGMPLEPVVLSASSLSPLFPSSHDTRTLTMTDGISGTTYRLFCDDVLVRTLAYSGGTGSFGTVSSPGRYHVERPDGYQVGNSIRLNLHEIFEHGNHEIYGDMLTPVSANGGTASIHGYINTIIEEECIATLEDWYNNKQNKIDFWPDLGQVMTISLDEDLGEIDIALLCPPNLNSSPRTFDTRMKLYMNEDETLIFTQPGGGQLLEYELSGSAPDSNGRFNVTLSGSQYMVTYKLMHEGQVISTKTGNGNPIVFNSLSASGEYSVMASYGSSTLSMSDTFIATVAGELGGNNYISVETFNGGTSALDVTYYGGLGYPVQEVRTSFAGTGRDLVRGIVYDGMRRADAVTMLPYARTGMNSHYDPQHMAAQTAYYAAKGFGNGINARAIKSYDDGLSGRLRSSRREGDAYVTAQRDVKYSYLLNEETDAVRDIRYHHPSVSSQASVKDHGLRESGTLKVTRTVSEDRDTSYMFSDMRDRLVLSRQMSNGVEHDTYYVYDLRDSLVCVIPPKAMEQMDDEFLFDGELAKRWCFTYKYDARGNLIERGVPGAGREVMIYDPRGRLVLYADATMNAVAQRYRYTIYDSMDRIVEEGIGRLDPALETARTSIMAGAEIKTKLSQTVPLRTCTYYKSGDFPDGYLEEDGFMWESSFCGLGATTQLKTERVWEDPAILPSGVSAAEHYVDRTYFYDEHGRVVQMLETDSEGWTSRYSTAYDLMGNITACLERHTRGTEEDWMKTDYTYDARGRVMSYRRTVNGIALDEVEYTYDDLGRLASKDVVEKIEEDYSYNLQGWQTGHEVSLYGNPSFFSESMKYYNPSSASTEARYGGFISETVSNHSGSNVRSLQYGYDPLGRLVSAVDGASGVSENFTYDKNGNMLSATKALASNATDAQTFNHDGNRLISDAGTSHNSTYTHWPNGSLRTDSSQNLQICCNFRNLPCAFIVGSMTAPSAEVMYLWDGTKVRTSSALGQGRLYKGSFVYSVSPTGTQLESISHDEGRILAAEGASGTEFIDTWHVRDYLGSVRAVYDISTPANEVEDVSEHVLEQSDYYAFGERIEVSGQAFDQTNRYRYNGKEQLRFEGINLDPGLTDYGARYYAPTFGRWTTPDPLADKYYSVSPYAFCGNNPVNFVDPFGMDWYSTIEEVEDENGKKSQETRYYWTEAKSQKEMDGLGIKGTYLGEAVVIFKGYYDEKLGKDGTLTGEGAKAASVNIYGINGPDDIKSYHGLSVSSNPDKYPMLIDGEYRLFHQQMAESVYGKGSLTYRVSDLYGNLELNPVGGYNKATGAKTMTEIFFHRTNNDGGAKYASVGCLVIDGREWKNVERQLGKSKNIYLKLTRK